ncbi:Tgs1, partial [Symbiodinium microadriaticum]
HNAGIYGVADRIDFVHDDFAHFAEVYSGPPIDAVFLSPPWGGPGHLESNYFSLRDVQVPDIVHLFAAAAKLSPRVALYLPRHTDLHEIAILAAVNGFSAVEVEKVFFQHPTPHLKLIVVYFSKDVVQSASHLKSTSRAGLVVVLGKRRTMASVLLLLSALVVTVVSVPTAELGVTQPCAAGSICDVDGYVGSKVIFEDDVVRVWNFTLPPGASTSLHRHDLDYHFTAVVPTQLAVYGSRGERLFDFRAEGTLGFRVQGDLLEPTTGQLPFKVPRVHSAVNVGPFAYYEILYEQK